MEYLHAVHFTLEEACITLEEVIPVLEELGRLKATLNEIGYDVRGHHFFTGMGTNGTKPYPDEVGQFIERYRGLTAKGIVIENVDEGLIDFPAISSDGREVYFCFMLGESTIEYWHEIDKGFSGRQPIGTYRGE